MKHLIMLVGLPCSGKSTFIQNVVSEFKDDYKVISTDNIIEDRAILQNKTYNQIFKDEIKSATAEMNARVLDSIKSGHNIVWDQTNLTVKSRKSKLNMCSKDYIKIAIYFDVSLDEVLSRNIRPGKIIPENVIKNMSETIEIPSLDEGFDAVFKASMFNEVAL